MSTTLQAAFRAEFGRDPDGLWAAPGRLNLIGEHIDYAGGLCLPLALPQRTVVAAAARDDGRLRLRSLLGDAQPWDGCLDEVGPGHPSGWAAYPAGVLWALGHPAGGLDLLVGESVPPGAGLASSAALECAVALAVDALAGLGLAGTSAGRVMLAAACRRAENEIVGAPTGGMDQIASLCCITGHAVLLDCRDQTMRQVPLDLLNAGLALLVIDTRAPHRIIDGQYAARRRSAEQAAAELGLPSLRDASPERVDSLSNPLLRRRARHVVTEIARARNVVTLLGSGRIRDIGPLLNASHASLRDDLEVSSPELDCVVDAARAAGAVGARMTGGGFGGSALALVQHTAVTAVTHAVLAAAARHAHPQPTVHQVRSAVGHSDAAVSAHERAQTEV
ncbi:MAG: galactokinase [Actinomycetota bacterium]|jgi:galactokinase|nr:galactokinase [Actinomycetota bacterium]